MRAAIVSIGSELLHGVITDRNAAFLASELTAHGVQVVEVVQVGDSLSQIADALNRLSPTVELLLTTGGIGPTADDLTREAISQFAGQAPYVDEELLETVQSIFESRGQAMPEQNRKQAWLIPSATVLPNPNGTAPGWLVRAKDTTIITLPGPPRENQPMWRDTVLPKLIPELGNQVIISRTLKTIGIGESSAERRISDIIDRDYPTVATYAKEDGVHIRVTATHSARHQAASTVDATIIEIDDLLGDYIYGDESTSLADAILKPLHRNGLLLTVWEAGTAGSLTSFFQTAPTSAETVADARSTSFTLAASAAGSDVPETIALHCARWMAAPDHSLAAVALVAKISPSGEPNRRQSEIGLALVEPSGETTSRYTITASQPEVRRRAVLWTAEFLFRTLRKSIAARPI